MRLYGYNSIPDTAKIIDSGYVESWNRDGYKELKEYWKKRNATLVKVKTDTKGLINYVVVDNESVGR